MIGPDVRITWTATAGKRYIVQTNATPQATGFADLGSVIEIPADASLSSTNFVDTGAAAATPARCYRVRLVP